MAILRPEWATGLLTSLDGAEPKAFWYLSRAGAMVAYVLFWASMAFGLAITNKMLRAWPGGPTPAVLHEYVSLLGLAFAAFHALILIWDGYSKYTLGQVLIPFASTNYRPLWVGLGQVAVYLLLPVTCTFYLRRAIGYRLFRQIHYLSFAVFALALGHGLLSGTDSGARWIRDLYWASAVSIAGLLAYRFVRAPAQASAA
jgi:predicted ferric reductase